MSDIKKEQTDAIEPDEYSMDEEANARHMRLHAATEPGELLPEPYRTEADARFQIGDEVFFRFPARVRQHGEQFQNARLTGRVLKIRPGFGELYYHVQATGDDLSESLIDNPAFLLRDSDIARLG